MIAAFYTYIHRRADDGKVFYVGKGKGRRAHSRDGRSEHWHRTVAKHGMRIEIVAVGMTEAAAFVHEVQLIAQYRAAGEPLCNRTDGGDGAAGRRHSDETRALISAKTRGKKRTPEQIKQNSEARRGRPLKPETAAKIAATLTGRKRSAQERARISAGRMGIKPSANTIAAVKAANTGIVRSVEFKAKVSAGLTGRTVSAETRAKLSIAHAGRVISQEQREKISRSLTGRRLSDAEKERRRSMTHSPESRAKHAAAMRGRPWSAARRAAHERRTPF